MKKLLRSGRFDRVVNLPLPQKDARVSILSVHTKNTPLSKNVDINYLSNKTEGYSGAELKSLVVEAAINAAYDSTISNWMSEELNEPLGKYMSLGGTEQQNLRYGENPHQKAKFYNDGSNRKGLITSHQIQGKELSYNNINDTNAAFGVCQRVFRTSMCDC